MKLRPYWVFAPAVISFCFFSCLDFFYKGGELPKGVLLSIPSYFLCLASFVLLKKLVVSVNNKNTQTLWKKFVIYLLVLIVVIFGGLFIGLDSESEIITIAALNLILLFIFLANIFSCLRSGSVHEELTENPDGSKYNPTNGLPTYSGYLDIKGNPIGVKVTKI